MKRFFSLLMVCVLVLGMTMSMAAPAMAAETSYRPYYLREKGDIEDVPIYISGFTNSDKTVRVKIGTTWFTCPVKHVTPTSQWTTSTISVRVIAADLNFLQPWTTENAYWIKNGEITIDIIIGHSLSRVNSRTLYANGNYSWITLDKVDRVPTTSSLTGVAYRVRTQMQFTANKAGRESVCMNANRPYDSASYCMGNYSVTVKVTGYDAASVVMVNPHHVERALNGLSTYRGYTWQRSAHFSGYMSRSAYNSI